MILEKAHLCVISNLILQTLVVWRVQHPEVWAFAQTNPKKQTFGRLPSS